MSDNISEENIPSIHNVSLRFENINEPDAEPSEPIIIMLNQ